MPAYSPVEQSLRQKTTFLGKTVYQPFLLIIKLTIMGISRRLENSGVGIWRAIRVAKNKKDHPPSYGNILSSATSTRVDSTYTALNTARNTLAAKIFLSTQATKVKNAAQAKLQMINSHYIQVFNFMIDEEIFPKEYRSFFNRPVTSGAVPLQRNGDDVKQLAEDIITGEAAMIAAGGTALLFPTVANVTAALTAYNTAATTQSNAKEETDIAEEALAALMPDARKVMVKVWDEVETYFNEETIESRRVNAREWGRCICKRCTCGYHYRHSSAGNRRRKHAISRCTGFNRRHRRNHHHCGRWHLQHSNTWHKRCNAAVYPGRLCR